MSEMNVPPASRRCTLLVVDDKPDNLLVMEALLGQEIPECHIVGTKDPQAALQLAADLPADAVLVDVQMPVMDGIELCRRLKQAEPSQDIPVVLITAHCSTPLLRAQGLDAGADDFITRPINNAELGAKIRAVLRIKAAEDKLRALNAELQDLVADRTHELSSLNQQLEAKNAELATLLDVTSHDLRNPLMNIDGFSREVQQSCREAAELLQTDGSIAEGVLQRVSDILDRRIPEYIGHVRSGVRKMDALIAGLLLLSRLGRSELVIERLSVQAILQDVLATMDFQIGVVGAQVQIDTLPDCMGDALQVNQVFSNLLDNALKYRDLQRPCCIRIWGESGDERITYHVQDNGIGIAREHLPKIFDVFCRLEPKRVPGEGLGLTSIKRILDRLKGSIRVESELGQGSTFTVSLPSP